MQEPVESRRIDLDRRRSRVYRGRPQTIAVVFGAIHEEQLLFVLNCFQRECLDLNICAIVQLQVFLQSQSFSRRWLEGNDLSAQPNRTRSQKRVITVMRSNIQDRHSAFKI